MITSEFIKTLEKNRIFFNNKLHFDTIQERKKKMIELFEKKGYKEINAVLIDFLCHFLDQELLFINKFSYADNMHFRLERSLMITYAVKGIERDFDLKGLIPFGMLYREHMNLFIDSNDRVYASMDKILIHLGNNPFDALLNILNHKEIERIEI